MFFHSVISSGVLAGLVKANLASVTTKKHLLTGEGVDAGMMKRTNYEIWIWTNGMDTLWGGSFLLRSTVSFW